MNAGKPKLKYWTAVIELMANNEEYPSISLTDEQGGYSLSCKVNPCGKITISTSSRGGHGEGSHEDKGRTAQEWIDLIVEAEEVRKYYWGE